MRKNKKRIEKAKESLSRLMDKYERCFARDPDVPPPSIPRKLARHIIELKEGMALGKSPGMRRRSEADEEFINSIVERLLEYGLIKRSNAQHACQVHIAKTPGREPRFCVDYRPVNEVTKENPFPLPRMDDLLYGMNGATVFSTLDAQKGFWQIRMGKGVNLPHSGRLKECLSGRLCRLAYKMPRQLFRSSWTKCSKIWTSLRFT